MVGGEAAFFARAPCDLGPIEPRQHHAFGLAKPGRHLDEVGQAAGGDLSLPTIGLETARGASEKAVEVFSHGASRAAGLRLGAGR